MISTRWTAPQNSCPAFRPQKRHLFTSSIARDNEKTIGAALETIRKFVDDIVVVDTGSTDKTPEIAVSLGARVFYFPWCDDFSVARNESIRHASGQWIFCMDTDDVIDEDNARKIRELVMAVEKKGSGPIDRHGPAGASHARNWIQRFNRIPTTEADPDSGAWRIERGRHVIGRSKECTIHVIHSSVSRRHAELLRKDDKLSISDLGSRNGTIIDGKLVRHAEIAIGTSVQLGEVTLELLDRRPSRFQATCDDEETDPSTEEAKATDLRTGGPFSPQRVRVLRLLVRGCSEKEVAWQARTTEYAVHWHVKGLYQYYGVHSRAELVARIHPTVRTI